MVTITNYAQRTNAEGENLYALIIQGGIEMIKSKETDTFYATANLTTYHKGWEPQALKLMHCTIAAIARCIRLSEVFSAFGSRSIIQYDNTTYLRRTLC